MLIALGVEYRVFILSINNRVKYFSFILIQLYYYIIKYILLVK